MVCGALLGLPVPQPMVWRALGSPAGHLAVRVAFQALGLLPRTSWCPCSQGCVYEGDARCLPKWVKQGHFSG